MNDFKMMRAIRELTQNEGDALIIYSDNPDFLPPYNNAIDCETAWTDYSSKRFTGENLGECFEKALKYKRSIEETH